MCSKKFQQQTKVWTVSFVMVLIISLCDSMNGGGVQNGINILVTEAGGTLTFAGVISSVFSFVALVSRFIAGNLSDHIGRKKVLIAAGVFILIGNVLPLFSSNIIFILPSRVITAVGFAIGNTAAGAAVADIVPANRLGEAMGYQGLANAISLAFGPLSAVVLAQSFGRLGMFGAFSAIGLLMVVLALLCNLKQQNEAVDYVQENQNKELNQQVSRETNPVGRFLFTYIEKGALRVSLVSVLSMTAMSIYHIFISTYAQTYHLSSVNLFFIIACVVMLIIRATCSKIFDRYPISLLVIPSLVAGAVGFVVLLLFHAEWSLCISGVCFGLANGLLTPGLQTEAIKQSPSNRKGAAVSTFWISYDIGMIISGILWGYTIEHVGFGFTLICASALMLISAVVSFFVLKKSAAK